MSREAMTALLLATAVHGCHVVSEMHTATCPVCLAVAGSMDSGKSTLVAVLTHGVDGRPLLDNGHGSARMAVFRHKHEIETGRTSSISQQMLGYDDEGKVRQGTTKAAGGGAHMSSRVVQWLSSPSQVWVTVKTELCKQC